MNAESMMILGQILGFVAVVLGFVSYQVKTAGKLLVIHTVTCLVFTLHYFLLGATPAGVLNLVGTVRNIVYRYKGGNRYADKYAPCVFAVIMLILGVLSWEGVHSVLVVAGLVINTVCMSFKDPQNIRKSILVTSPMVLAYDAFELSVGGMIYESVVIVSSVIGIFRYRRREA